jgi:hypothetical protein
LHSPDVVCASCWNTIWPLSSRYTMQAYKQTHFLYTRTLSVQ